jgi:hypothetical protein
VRRPKGYLGLRHETIGSDILAVYRCLMAPETVLGGELATKLAAVDAAAWYPIGWLLELMELLDQRLGAPALRKMGRTLFKLSHEEVVKAAAHSARDVLYGFDEMYHRANRGEKIGGWRVASFDPGQATLEKTTPHHCVMEEGILAAALQVVGVPSLVEQKGCFRADGESCLYVVTSPITDARWTG